MYVYQLDITRGLMICKYEIVKETPCYYHIEPREIPNKRAMDVSQKIGRGDVFDPEKGNWSVSYFPSKESLFECLRKQANAKIRHALGTIKFYSLELARLDLLEKATE